MFDYAQLETLAAILRAGSLEAAARQLGLTPSAVSQRLRALEDRVGAVLVVRAQPCRATPEGAQLARHLETVRLLEQELPQASRAVRPVVKIAVNADSLASWFLPALTALEDTLFDLVIDDQDHSEDWLRRGEVMAAVTAARGPVQGCDTHPLGALRYLATASPAFVARWFPQGVTAETAARAPALTFDHKDRLQARWLAGNLGRNLGFPTHMLPSPAAFVAAAELGLGWGLNPEPMVREALAAGRLVALDSEGLETPLYWQVARIAALEPLTRAVRKVAAAALH